ncbi:hypothetical protein K502DRAFT_329291 [Neoconidiobolus thromboides FSU 785]|nr:hypothetical protein K502DRAFT_329291 [Neoconidiobolus thromboides FSU 785]
MEVEEFTIELNNQSRSIKDSSIKDISLENGSIHSTKPTKSFLLPLIILSLILSIFLSSMDETIVASSLYTILAYFQENSSITWLTTSYLLTMTATQPLYGKLSNLFGTKYVHLIAILLFLIGSIGCGLAPNLISLIIFRGLTGLGGGGLVTLAYIIVSEIVPIHKRSLYQSIIGSTFTLASICGPLIGGALTQYLNWRWNFFINIPIVIVAAIIILFFLPNNHKSMKDKASVKLQFKKIDFLGALVLIISNILLILGLTWASHDYPWSSPNVICCLVFGILLFIIFLFVEKYYAKEPIIPSTLFNRNSSLVSLSSFMYCTVYFTLIFYWPLYHQTVFNKSPLNAGLELLSASLSICVTSVLSGILCNKFKVYLPIMRGGTIMLVIGVCLMALLRDSITEAELIIYPILIGGGIGFNTQLSILCGQLAVTPENAGIITSFITFSQSFGGIFGLAIFGTIYNSVLRSNLLSQFPDLNIDSFINNNNALHSLDPSIKGKVIESFIQAYRTLFLSMIPFCVVALICTFGLKNISLTESKSNNENENKNKNENEVKVIE